jgi:hypothetical protein
VIVVGPRCSSIRMSGKGTAASDGGWGDRAAGNGNATNSPTAVGLAALEEEAAARRSHPCTRLVFNSCASAIAATEAPGSLHAATTALFNSGL